MYVVRVCDDGELTFEDANEFVATIAGKTLSDIRGRPIGEALLPQIADCVSTHVRTVVQTGDSSIRLTVKDDGVGLNASGTGIPGVGLHGMHERLNRLGGDLSISGDRGGTSLIATIPVNAGVWLGA